jgi:hypothetical protein
MLNHMARISLFSNMFSPDATTLETPNDSDEWLLECRAKWPKWFSLVLDRWALEVHEGGQAEAPSCPC